MTNRFIEKSRVRKVVDLKSMALDNRFGMKRIWFDKWVKQCTIESIEIIHAGFRFELETVGSVINECIERNPVRSTKSNDETCVISHVFLFVLLFTTHTTEMESVHTMVNVQICDEDLNSCWRCLNWIIQFKPKVDLWKCIRIAAVALGCIPTDFYQIRNFFHYQIWIF